MKNQCPESECIFQNIIRHVDRHELNAECQQWALAHGFVQRCLELDTTNDSFVCPYPFTIHPSPYPKEEYERACRMQYGINTLIHRLASNVDLMDQVFQSLIGCDPFIQRLRDIYSQIRDLPYRSTVETCIIRTDYLLQTARIDSHRTKLRLVEINTIAVGLGAAAKLMHQWHKRFLMRMAPTLLAQLPDNGSHDLIIDTLYESWQLYNNPKALVLFLVPEREFNIGDQLLIERGLLSRGHPSLLVKHVTLSDISRCCSLDSLGTLHFNREEVGLIYYRCAYDPRHFYSEEIWQAFIMLESSRAVKCPSLSYHLAGMKCFQLALVNEQFLDEVFQEKKQFADDFREITEEMFTVDQAMTDSSLQHRIRTRPDSFYLKQSREGGGNVYCGSRLKERIDQIIAAQESNRYFLMSRVYAPTSSTLIRLSRPRDQTDGLIVDAQINGELGIFGSLISKDGAIVSERTAGSLLRSKSAMSIEGGIASGQGCIDSVLLV